MKQYTRMHMQKTTLTEWVSVRESEECKRGKQVGTVKVRMCVGACMCSCITVNSPHTGLFTTFSAGLLLQNNNPSLVLPSCSFRVCVCLTQSKQSGKPDNHNYENGFSFLQSSSDFSLPMFIDAYLYGHLWKRTLFHEFFCGHRTFHAFFTRQLRKCHHL